MSKQNCPECGSNKLSYDENGLVCQNCGLVVESNLMFAEPDEFLF